MESQNTYPLTVLSLMALLVACSHTKVNEKTAGNDLPKLEKIGKGSQTQFRVSDIQKDSRWARIGLRDGDVITQVNGEKNIPEEKLLAKMSQAVTENPITPNIQVLRKEKGEEGYEPIYLANQYK